MSSKILLSVVLAILLTSIATAEMSEKVYLEYTTHPEVIKPGTAGYIQLKITNPSTEVIGYLYFTRVEADAPVEVQKPYSRLGALYPGGVKQVVLKFRVPEDARPGFYVVRVFLSANYQDYTSALRFDIPLEVREMSSLQLSLSPAEVEAGETANLTLSVQNPGSEVRDLRISWSGDGIVPLGRSSSVFVRSLGPGTTIKVPLRVRAEVTGTALMRFEITYSDTTGIMRSETHPLGVEVRTREMDYIRLTLHPELLEVGQKGRLVFSLSNEGSEELRNVLLSWSSDVLLPASSSSEFIESLRAGENKEVSFSILVDEGTEPGYYPLHVSLKYDSQGREVEENRTFGVEVAGKISLVATLFRAEAGKVFISIANTGNAPAKNLVAFVSSPYGRAESFIGDLEAGDEEILEVTQRGSAERYNLSLRLTYRDVFGRVFEELQRVEVHHPAGGVPAKAVAAAALAAIGIASGVWFWRKR